MYDSKDIGVITSIEPKKAKSVVLTFDDGPSRVLPEILDVLREEKVRAVFFWQTRLLYSKRPWTRVLEEGHLIGTHSCKHRNLVKLSFNDQFQDLYSSILKLEDVTGIEVKYFRPPFGQYNQDTLLAAEKLHLTPVMWKIASMDWELKQDPNRIITNVVEHLEDGAIILLHELPQTLEVLKELIREIRSRGFEFSLL
ncbi:polysaccharide deacetylase family protein [Cytobacillus sp. FJAT-54145]|uniref:Polysaccharide deacetylase family protein n=1 Tax=Cytobacillus spartinae TaxID=3299023 RepID=A0ABW6K719_9BACI